MATPDEVVEQRPAVCVKCQAPLVSEAPAVARERRQVQDLPPVCLHTTDYQALCIR
jgi:hypothetical protein